MNQKYLFYTFLVFFAVMPQTAPAMKKANKNEHSEHQSQIKLIEKEIKNANKRFQKLSKPFKDEPAISVDENGTRYLKFEALKTIAGQHAYKELIELDTVITRLYMQIDDLKDECNQYNKGFLNFWNSAEEDTIDTAREFPSKT